jgi:hypothetical protein
VSQQDDTDATGEEIPAEPRPQAEPEPTGVPAADAARTRLAAVDGAALEEHVEVYEDVHRGLQEGLADLDER